MIGVISICIFVSFVISELIVGFRKDKYNRLEKTLENATLLFIALFIINSLIVGSTQSDKESNYTQTVNGQNFYCELTPVKYDASFIWPGWTPDRYTDASEVTCYKLDEPVNIEQNVKIIDSTLKSEG